MPTRKLVVLDDGLKQSLQALSDAEFGECRDALDFTNRLWQLLGAVVEEESSCDKCGRGPNGDSPDNLQFFDCHMLCDECSFKNPIADAPEFRQEGYDCPVCGEVLTKGGLVY